MQQQNLGYHDARNHPIFDCCSECEESAVASKLTGRTVTYQTSACCSLTVVYFRVAKIDSPACDSPVVNRSTCIQVRADDVEELPCGVQEEKLHIPAVGWSPNPRHTAQAGHHAIGSDGAHLSFKEPHDEYTDNKHQAPKPETPPTHNSSQTRLLAAWFHSVSSAHTRSPQGPFRTVSLSSIMPAWPAASDSGKVTGDVFQKMST